CALSPPRAPPRPPFFPYTTLFRSLQGRRQPRPGGGQTRRVEGQGGAFQTRPLGPPHGDDEQARARLGQPQSGVQLQRPDRVTGLDRKSTRLNSSHVKISYAVFCLK